MQNEKEDLKIEVEDLSSVEKKLNVTVPSKTVTREINALYKNLSANASVSGFRKGSVPRSVLMAKYGETVQTDVAARLVESTYPYALREKSLIPVANPKFEMESSDILEGKDFAYSITFEVNPEVDVDGYMGMEIKKAETATVTEADIEGGLKRLHESHVELKEVDRPAADGDTVVLDFEAKRNNKPIKGWKAEDFQIIIGEMTPLPGFDEAVKGVSSGEKKEATLKFPDDYSDGSLAGKEGLFSITVKSVKEKLIPPLDDEFAKDLDCENLVELKAKVQSEIEKANETQDRESIKTWILDKLIEAHPFEVPGSMVTRYHAVIMNNIVESMRVGMIDPKDKDLSADEFKEKYRREAERRVREDIILDSIAAKERIEVSKEETEAAVKHLAESRNVSFDSLMSRIEREGSLEVIQDGLKHGKVFDIIIASSKPAA
jgi:trigger factor